MKEQGERLEEEWRREAMKLRQNRWGGELAIMAYGLMHNRRVSFTFRDEPQHVHQCPSFPYRIPYRISISFWGCGGFPFRIYSEKPHCHGFLRQARHVALAARPGASRPSAKGGEPPVDLRPSICALGFPIRDLTGNIVIRSGCKFLLAPFVSLPLKVDLVHILYNGSDHYDALEPLSNFVGMTPAWPQPTPALYWCPAAEARIAAGPSSQIEGCSCVCRCAQLLRQARCRQA